MVSRVSGIERDEHSGAARDATNTDRPCPLECAVEDRHLTVTHAPVNGSQSASKRWAARHPGSRVSAPTARRLHASVDRDSTLGPRPPGKSDGIPGSGCRPVGPAEFRRPESQPVSGAGCAAQGEVNSDSGRSCAVPTWHTCTEFVGHPSGTRREAV